MCCLQESNFRYKDTQRLKVKGWRKTFYANGNESKVGIKYTYVRQNRLK